MRKFYTKDKIDKFEKEIASFFEQEQIEIVRKMDLIKEVCNEIGFEVYSLDLPDKIDGAILVEKDDKLIGINNTLRSRDIRFVIAHELAHYIREVNKKQGDKTRVLFALKDTILHDLEKEPLENEMDYMAAAMLVPFDSFMKDLDALEISKEAPKEQEIDVFLESIDENKINILSNLYEVDKELIKRRIVEANTYGRNG